MLYPLYEATDTFLYTPGEVTKNASHVRDALDLKRMMITVVVALIPCTLMALYNTGYQANVAIANVQGAEAAGWQADVQEWLGLGHDPASLVDNFVYGALFFLPIYAVCMAVGGTWEVLFCIVRRHDINEGFLVTGLLFPLTLPPTIPLWQVALGISFGIVIGKEIFGGTGRNFLNPALTARAFLYFAYPGQISGDAVWVAADGYTGATALGAMAVGDLDKGLSAVVEGLGYGWWDAFLGFIPGSMGETSALCALLGMIILIATGVGSWRIMAGVFAGGILGALFFNLIGSDSNAMFVVPFWWHLVIGGFAFGAVFMATDPVSASFTHKGKWIYGILIGLLTILIRVINPAYPEGIMLAILFGNVFAPLIDYFVVQANIQRRLARVT
ncbi:Na(+)-translocating NADH-quinone reductase subunit B [Planctomycetales bacterium 10988]|nr:Na(+)-translocating NADH-quinone reductase subunit B [Planctomycetales bacterium 10988]